MRIRFRRLALLTVSLTLLASAVVACASGPAPSKGTGSTDSKLDVTVSIVPQRYFVERIGGDHVTANVMVEPGASPATYEPKPEQMKALSDAAAYFSIGVPFESAWLDRIAAANEDMVMVDTIANVERMSMATHHHHEGEEEGERDYTEAPPDPHVWVSPVLVKAQSHTICEALVELDPVHEADYRANLKAFVADIEALETDVRATLTGLESKKFMVFHPSWGYFARDFGLEQIPIEVGGQEPSPQELAHLIEEAQEENIQVVFAQPEFSTKAAETIANEIGGRVLMISPLAEDWLANMRKVSETFAEVLGP
jgi:zinc transport system substrate-binding protein